MSVAASIEQQYKRGNALRMSGKFVMAEAALRDVLERAPDHRNAAYSLAHMLREDGRLNAAADIVGGMLEVRQGDADELLVGLAFLCECGAHARSHSIARAASERWSGDARIHAKMGEILLALGHFEEAAAALRDTLDRDPGQSASWLRLAHCRRFTSSSESDFGRFEYGWGNERLPPAAHVCAGFALGKALDDIGVYSRAVTVLREANGLARRGSSWSNQYWQAFFEERLQSERMPALGVDPGFLPVFIVGLPRTGTTLVSTRLAQSKDVRDRGELNWISTLYEHLSAHGKLLDVQALESAAHVICGQMRQDDAPARIYIDKNPLNFRYLDFIAALFPNARIIHCQRSPRDTALSQWMQHFADDRLGFSYDFSSIAGEASHYRRLMAHWRCSLDVSIFDLDYESFVFEPHTQQRRLAAFLGIDVPPAVPRLHEGVVATASVWQARQPAHTNSVGRWRRYGTFLPELVELFADQW